MKRTLLMMAAAAAMATVAAAAGGDASFSLGVPTAPVIREAEVYDTNTWSFANYAYPMMAVVAPASETNIVEAVSERTVPDEQPVTLQSCEAGFTIDRSIPDYYLGEELSPPENIDWTATYVKHVNNPESSAQFIFDPDGRRVFVSVGGTLVFTWVQTDGTEMPVTYTIAPACKGRPRRIYWTDHPYNAPGINLSGKFVKFFGSDALLTPKYGAYTNTVAGVEQVIANRIVSGLVLDQTSKILQAYGELQGQVLMAYYDTGSYDRLLHVQVVEVCRPRINILKGEIGRALQPDGLGYDTTGLRAMPTVVSPQDDRGEYLYQHKGVNSASPKNGCVYPLRPTVDCHWNAEIYWMETDEMEVEWPFELDHYECDWPEDTTVFVRGDVGGDFGRPIYVPGDYVPTLMQYQEPDGHAITPEADGTFATKGEGYSLLRLTANDNIWFVPIHSVLRSNIDYFTLQPSDSTVGEEMALRGGTVAGTAYGFNPVCDADSPGYIYEANSARIWNPSLYSAPKPDVAADGTNVTDVVAADGDTNTYASVVYAVTANGPDNQVEVWWNTTIREEDMPTPLEIPTLPQIYNVRWPKDGDCSKIVIASQRGSANENIFSHNRAIHLPDVDSWAQLSDRTCFGENGGTVGFWLRGEEKPSYDPAALLTLVAVNNKGVETARLAFDWRGTVDGGTNLVLDVSGNTVAAPVADAGWHHVAITLQPTLATVYWDGKAVATLECSCASFLGNVVKGWLGACDGGKGRYGVTVGELMFWNKVFTPDGIDEERYRLHGYGDDALTACYYFDEHDLEVTGTDYRTFSEKILGVHYRAFNCLCETKGPPALGTGVIHPDEGTTPKVYVQNDPNADGYNPNEEHAFLETGAGGYVTWALRCDLNTSDSSEPGVLVEYTKDGRKRMQWFDVVLTNDIYTALAGDCLAGKTLPGPHPLDLFDDPWRKETYWEEPVGITPAHRDRKGQVWAKAAGELNIHMFYPMQEDFAFPGLDVRNWPKAGESVPWLAKLDNPDADPVNAPPARWLWRISWPEVVPEIEIGRTLTVASSGLPEVWNAKSMGVVWPATDAERAATAVLFDPTVEQGTGTNNMSIAELVNYFGIKQGSGGNAHLRKGKWYFDGLPPSISSRFYLDTAADPAGCIKLAGEMEDNPGGVSLLHVNVLNQEERKVISSLLDETAGEAAKKTWRDCISRLAAKRVEPSPHTTVSGTEDAISYKPRDHYALFTMGATNYVTLIENDSTNKYMNVSDGDPISMHVIKVVPKYYTGRVVTREDPLNLLSQQLSVLYTETFAGSPEDYLFEWRKCRPHMDGTVPTDFDDEYTQRFPPTAGLTRFTIGGQGDTLANMVNTYYAMRYRAASTNAPAYATMGYAWSEWTDPPALAEGWVQRVLNNVTPFTQRMRDLVENEAETAVTMVRQAGAPYEGDVALNNDNLANIGLIQLYETILNKAESMSLQLDINDADANKQLQLAVARLADLYNLLGDEAYTDAMNPTIGFGSSFEDSALENYGARSSALFCFDNQVPTLLDEELALLRGRTGENAPSTHLSPYYNRLVWNFTRGMNAGEVAYAVNYDISGNNKGVIDYSQAAEMYPQGHGDAYGHYLSALSGYYRLLRNPNFSWGEPAMGEMVVADAVLNVDYYDEAQFAKTAYNVARTAAEAVDRTARKAYRDNGGASGAGYIDSAGDRNFGYGEWASRGGYGAFCNWAVANSLLDAEPKAGLYYHYAFTGGDSMVSAELYNSVPRLESNGVWTVEFQTAPLADGAVAGDLATLALLGDTARQVEVVVSNDLSLAVIYSEVAMTTNVYTYYTVDYTNANYAALADTRGIGNTISMTNGNEIAVCYFWCEGQPASFPAGFAFDDARSWTNGVAAVFPDFGDGWEVCTDANGKASAWADQSVETVYSAVGGEVFETGLSLTAGEKTMVALRCNHGLPTIALFDASGTKVAEKTIPLGIECGVESIVIGGGFAGEIGEFRVWDGISRMDAELADKRGYITPFAKGLAMYMRGISRTGDATQVCDEKQATLWWEVSGGRWERVSASGMSIEFTDEALARIDRSTVMELAELADLVPQMQRKVDQMDAGLNPLGLASGAMPFDLTPLGMESGECTHFEQMRERAETALANAAGALDRAQGSAQRMRQLQDDALEQETDLDTSELEFKNKLIEYFGYPYAGDIGPAGSYPQGYDGPDLYHYAWMDLSEFGFDFAEKSQTTVVKSMTKPVLLSLLVPFYPSSEVSNTITNEFTLSANGLIMLPDNITGKRRAQGKIQDALANFICVYAQYLSKIKTYESRLDDLQSCVKFTRLFSTAIQEAKFGAAVVGSLMNFKTALNKAALEVAINTLEATGQIDGTSETTISDAVPAITGAGLTVNTDPRSIFNAAVAPARLVKAASIDGALLSAKNALSIAESGPKITNILKDSLTALGELVADRTAKYEELRDYWYDVCDAENDLNATYRELQMAQAAIETVIAEAERVIDERTLLRRQAVDRFTKARYSEMFFRIQRDDALSRYSSLFDLAQKYVFLAAQAYDYETGLLSSDEKSGERFIAEIVGARALGEFDGGKPVVTSGNGDGGLADILARMDANWLVLKPRLGINNPQQYATWFSLRHDLFRIYGGEAGDKAWRTELRKHVVEDLNEVPEFRHYCQPLAGSTAAKEPGLVIPFSSSIAHGYNFFGRELASGDSALDSTYYATHIASAGVHLENYDRAVFANTPTAYLVPVGEDRMRAVGDPGTVLSWRVVDQTIPAPYAIGSTKLDDPDWTPLYDGNTGGNDLGARIRKHPSFRACYGAAGEAPGDESLDCTRLVGRSAWNTKWLLIIPAGSMNSDREAALAAFIGGVDSDRDGRLDFEGVKDIKIGLRTYSASGN